MRQAASPSPQEVEDIINWLREEARKNRKVSGFYASLDRQDNDWLYFAVRLEDKQDIYDKAVLLQKLEDAWHKAHPDSWQLLLIPSAE
ncbi:MAG TPA: hypothetical protein VFB38_24150 [Chthonomonadaceae bacterium]|nr:hypothetical protein [Chthonomonadaceae bacterium]